MNILGLIGILLGILTIILFITKKFSVIVAAPIATIVVLLLNDVPILASIFGQENSYMTALASFIASNFAIFLLGSILAKYMHKSGATVSIADKIMSIVGTKNPYNALVALFIISALLTYGGVNVFVIIFALIPMAKPIFKKLNISWKLVTIPIFGGTSTFTMTMLPGAPSLHNIVPSNALGTPLTAAPVIPAFMGVFQMIQSIPGPPVLSLMIGTGLISGVTASAVGAIGIAVSNFSPFYLDMGLSPDTIHRAIAIASGALAIVPYSGFLIIFNSLTGLTMKDTFKNGFISISVN